MDTTYPKEIYRNNHRRVVFGVEEDRDFQTKGWSETRDPEQQYVGFDSGIPENLPEAVPEVKTRKKSEA